MIYRVKLYFEGDYTVEVEAPDDETAEALAMELLDENSGKVCCQVIDAVVMKSDNQYTDSEEIEDGERRHKDKG